MFVAIDEPFEQTITVYFDNVPLTARVGETVATCLLRAGVKYFRTTPASEAKRKPYCMIGNCFDCLVEINGVGNRQACMTIVQSDMKIAVQKKAISINKDI